MEHLASAGRTLPLILVAVGIALALTAGAIAVVAIAADEEGRRIDTFGLAMELPPGWEGHVSRAPGSSVPQLVATNAEDDVRLVLSDHGAPVGENVYPLERALPIVIRPGNLGGLEGGRRTASYAFATGGRLFELVATFAGTPSDELLGQTNGVLRTLEVEPLVDQTPPTAERDAFWLQLVLVAAGFWSWDELDRGRQWNLAMPTGGPHSLHVWFTNTPREPEGRVTNDGVRAAWGVQGLTLWVSPVGDWEIDRRDLRRLVRASLRVPRR